MLAELDTYDWAEVFGEGGGGNCTPIHPLLVTGALPVSTETFSREDVAEIKGICEGERDGPDWIAWGILKDGRYFLARGGCDYTGWDCQASNSGDIAATEADLIRLGMTNDERDRFGVTLAN